MTVNSTCYLVRTGTKGGRAILRVSGNSYVNVAANSTVNSEISNANSTNDPIVGCTVTGLWWSAQTNPIQVARGANTVLNLNGTGSWSAAQGWQGESSYPLAANVVFTIKDAASSLYIELTKVVTGSNPPT